MIAAGYFVMLVWPVVAIWLFRRYHPATALTLTVIGGYLIMPTRIAFNLPGFPAFDKFSAGAIAALIGVAVGFYGMSPRERGRILAGLSDGMVLKGALPRSAVALLLLGMVIVGNFGTVLSNGDPLVYERLTIPGNTLYDAVSQLATIGWSLIVFILARKFLGHPGAHRRMLAALCVLGLIYFVAVAWEVRFSPQLSVHLYGVFPHSFLQHMRGSGFRPIVFLQHGLMVSIFMCCAALAALALWRDSRSRASQAESRRWLMVSGVLFLGLLLCKGMGAILIYLALAPVMILGRAGLRLSVAALIALVLLTYPALRTALSGALDALADYISQFNPTRADSFSFRLYYESLLLDRASERPLFGWGSWGRDRVRDIWGNDISVSDGFWIITLGIFGWVGYIATMGLLALPGIVLALRKIRYQVSPTTAAVALILAANLIDMIPNYGISPVTWLLAGALAGRLELGRLTQSALDEQPIGPRVSAYSRRAPRPGPSALAMAGGAGHGEGGDAPGHDPATGGREAQTLRSRGEGATRLSRRDAAQIRRSKTRTDADAGATLTTHRARPTPPETPDTPGD